MRGEGEEDHVEVLVTCCLCGAPKALRPLGPDGSPICYDCGVKPENVEETKRQFARFVAGWIPDESSITTAVDDYVKKVFK